MGEFMDLAEAKQAMLDVINRLDEDQEEVKAEITQAGDDMQKRIMNVIPVLQKTLAAPLEKYGFPAGGPGIMSGVVAFQKIVDSNPDAAADIKDGMDLLKKGMMGTFPSSEQIA